MADIVEGGEAGFWLPSEFLVDFLDDKENLNDTSNNDTEPYESGLCFPNEFPFDFEADKDGHFEKDSRGMPTSPQSTLLAHLWTSPPTTPLSAAENDAVGDLVYRVAKLKLSGAGPQLHTPARTRSPSVYHNNVRLQQQGQGRGVWYGQTRVAGHEAWVVQQNPTRMVGPGRRVAMLGGSGSGGKRECAGTGVFLPRRYGNNSNNECNASYSSVARKKPGYAAASIPNRNDHRALHMDFSTTNGFAPPTPNFPPKFNAGFVSDYDLMVARRNALLLQHQRHRLQLQSLLLEGSSPSSRGGYLPQEWTY